MENLTLPKYVTYIGENAFGGCKNLSVIVLPNKITKIADNTFNGCKCLKDINLSPNIKYIGENAFAQCSSLENLTLPKYVTYIGENAFGGCISIKAIEIPSNYILHGRNVFDGCSNITDLTVHGKKSLNFIYESFINIDLSQTQLHGPEACLALIRNKHIPEPLSSDIQSGMEENLSISEYFPEDVDIKAKLGKKQKELSPTPSIKKERETKSKAFICCIPGKRLNHEKLWKWIIDEFQPTVKSRVEWVAIYTLLYHNNCLLTNAKYKAIYEETEERLKKNNVQIHPTNNLCKFDHIITNRDWIKNGELIKIEDWNKSISDYRARRACATSTKDLTRSACEKIYYMLQTFVPIFNINEFLEQE